MIRFDELNEPQRQAVEHKEGPLLILAGAGSGKTRVITYRLAYLLQYHNIPAQKLLAVTFTNKAADEMRERLSQLAGKTTKKVILSTFHSLGVRILRKQAEHAGYRKNFVIYDQNDQLSLVREIIKDRALDFAGHNAYTLLSRISSAKNLEETPEKYLDQSNPEEVLFGDLYKHYLERTRGCNAIDFDDILILVSKLLEDNEEIRRYYQQFFEYIMVDEYQDTNRLQFRFIELLLGESRNICVVGDDDQAVYSWRGADPEIILEFENHFIGARVIKLEQNYRSTQTILTAANTVIAHNRRRVKKQLWSAQAGGARIAVLKAQNELEEAEKVMGMIQSRKLMVRGANYSHFAVLVRTNFQLRPLEEAARAVDLPYQLIGGTSFYERPEIRNVISYLKTIKNPSDELNFKRALQFPKRGVGATSLLKAYEHCRQHNMSLFQAFQEAEHIADLRPAAKHAMAIFVNLIKDYQKRFRSGSISAVAANLVKEVGFIEALKETVKELKARDAKINNVREFLGSIQRFEQKSERKGLSTFLDRISLITNSDYLKEKEERAIFLTVHSAKGLEFPYVFLYGMNDGQFPSKRALEEGSLEEERRLCYVAMTRAQKELTISYAVQKKRYKEILQLEPSRFLKEMSDDVLEAPVFSEEKPEAKERRKEKERDDVAAMFKRFREQNFKMG